MLVQEDRAMNLMRFTVCINYSRRQRIDFTNMFYPNLYSTRFCEFNMMPVVCLLNLVFYTQFFILFRFALRVDVSAFLNAWQISLVFSVTSFVLHSADFAICAVNSMTHINSYDNLATSFFSCIPSPRFFSHFHPFNAKYLHFMKHLEGLWAIFENCNALSFIESQTMAANEMQSCCDSFRYIELLCKYLGRLLNGHFSGDLNLWNQYPSRLMRSPPLCECFNVVRVEWRSPNDKAKKHTHIHP